MLKYLSLFSRAALVTVLLVGGTLRCAGDKGVVNRVQPNYVKKSDLLGKTWYYRRTVIDTPAGMAPYLAIGSGDLFTLERVKFEVQEDYLVAYRDAEYVTGSEEATEPGNTTYQGDPVAAFPIEKQFDIIYDYNPQTGEKTNVRVENTTDRPWYDRDYIRVKWSNTILAGNSPYLLPVDYLDTDNTEGSYLYADENAAANPDRARIEPQKGYMDFVNTHFVQPDPFTCMVEYDFRDNPLACGAGVVKVRHSFMQVDKSQDETYAPLNFPDDIVLKDNNGNDITDPATGGVEREDIFGRFGFYRLNKLTYDRERELTETGRINRILRFNIWQKSIDANGNVIPYAQRTVRPINYYLNWDFPADLRDTAYQVASEWDDAFKTVVGSLQGKDPSQVPDVFILHDNDCNLPELTSYLEGHPDVKASAEKAVGQPLGADALENWCAATTYYSQNLTDGFHWEQIGDTRYNMLDWITAITPSDLLGYGPMFADPLTGRNVSASVFITGWNVDYETTNALEYIDYMNGALSMQDLLQGSNLPDYFFQGNYDPQAYTHDIDSAQAQADHVLSSTTLANLNQRFDRLGSTPQQLLTPIDNSSYYTDRLARVQGSQLDEQYLIRPEDLMLASNGSWQPGMKVPDSLYQQASFINRAKTLTTLRRSTDQLLEEHTMMPESVLDPVLVGLAKKLKDLPIDQRREALRRAIFRSVALHELGHNMGLRHNFEASYDALNYNPKYWQIDQSLGNDEQAKLEAEQPEFKYSSIMDYGGRINSDFQGLGQYDLAAIKFGYGQLIETFADPSVQGGQALRDWEFSNDYKKLPQHIGSVAAMENRKDVVFDWTKTWNPTDLQNLLKSEVPYRFCSDEYAYRTPYCKPFDYGANQREEEKSDEIRYKNYFLFSNYLRNRLVLNEGGVLSRGYEVFRDIVTMYQYWYYYRATQGDAFTQTDLYADMATAVTDGLNLMSSVISMPSPDTYYRCTSPTNPSDVTYYSVASLNYDPAVDPTVATGPNGEQCNMNDHATLPVGEVYPMFVGFSQDLFEWTITYLGTYWDKLSAIQELTDPTVTFYRVNGAEDMRTYSVSLYRIFPQEVNNMLLPLIELDPKKMAGNWDPTTQQWVGKQMVPQGSPSTLPKLAAPTSRNLQLYSLLFGMADLTSPLDNTLDFGDNVRVALKGGADDFFSNTPGATTASCTLPEQSITYVAETTHGTISDIDVAYNYVKRCSNEVAARQTALTARDAANTALNAVSTSDPNYESLYQAYLQAENTYTNADSELRNTEQTLQFMHELDKVYEYGGTW